MRRISILLVVFMFSIFATSSVMASLGGSGPSECEFSRLELCDLIGTMPDHTAINDAVLGETVPIIEKTNGTFSAITLITNEYMTTSPAAHNNAVGSVDKRPAIEGNHYAYLFERTEVTDGRTGYMVDETVRHLKLPIYAEQDEHPYDLLRNDLVALPAQFKRNTVPIPLYDNRVTTTRGNRSNVYALTGNVTVPTDHPLKMPHYMSRTSCNFYPHRHPRLYDEWKILILTGGTTV